MSDKKNRVSHAYGFTIGFDGRFEFAPIATVRFYNVDVASATIVCHGEVADLAQKHPERISISCKDCDYNVGLVSRSFRDNSVHITVAKKQPT